MLFPHLFFLIDKQNRQFYTWLVTHYHQKWFISLEDDDPVDGDELPQGSTPIWIDVPRHTTHLEILKEMEKLTTSRSVTVLYDEHEDTGAADFCNEKNWNYRHWKQMFGCEDEAIIAIDCVTTEAIARPYNLLVMVTTPGYK